MVRELSRLSRHISRSSRPFLDYPDTFSRLSGHFLNCPETFQFIQTLFRSSRHFPVHLDTLHITWILCIASRHFPNYMEILQPIMTWSGFAMLPCYQGYSNSADFLDSYWVCLASLDSNLILPGLRDPPPPLKLFRKFIQFGAAILP